MIQNAPFSLLFSVGRNSKVAPHMSLLKTTFFDDLAHFVSTWNYTIEAVLLFLTLIMINCSDMALFVT